MSEGAAPTSAPARPARDGALAAPRSGEPVGAPIEPSRVQGGPTRSAGPREHLALLVVQLAFASLAVEGKLAMSPGHGVSPLALGMARIGGGALVFVALHVLLRTPRVERRADQVRLVLSALFGIVINQALFLLGLARTSALAATLLVATIPIFTLAVAVLARKERFTARAALGIALALVGVLALSGFAAPKTGDLLVTLNALSYAIYLVIVKEPIERYGPVTVIAWVFGVGALAFAPLGLAALVRELPSFRASTLGLVGFLVLVPTVLAYGLNAFALRRASPGLVTIYIYLQPLVVAGLAWAQLGERPGPLALLAALFVLAGVTVVATRKPSPGGASPGAPPRATTRAA